MKKFKPFLAPNKIVDIHTLKYPLLASFKLDGIRCIIKDGEMCSRSLKPINNVKLHEKFKQLKQFTINEAHLKPILDGELLARSMPFNALSGTVRASDRELPEDMYFYLFDSVINEQYDTKFILRTEQLNKLGLMYPDLIKIVEQKLVHTSEQVEEYFQEALDFGCDGLILHSLDGKYKCGRGTINEGIIYKMKPYLTFDAKIIDVIQSTKVNPNAEKKINELGRSVTSKKKEDRILIDKACDFVVMHEGEAELKVMIAMTDEEKKEVWKNKESYIGRYIEYKGLMVGAKDLPRHPVYLRMRDDKA